MQFHWGQTRMGVEQGISTLVFIFNPDFTVYLWAELIVVKAEQAF
jgi:hypothetical protein